VLRHRGAQRACLTGHWFALLSVIEHVDMGHTATVRKRAAVVLVSGD